MRRGCERQRTYVVILSGESAAFASRPAPRGTADSWSKDLSVKMGFA